MSALLGPVHHLGVAVADIEKALPFYAETLGYRLFDGPHVDPIQRVRVAFLRREGTTDPVIELIAPAADDSPVNNYLRKEVGAYHMCYEVIGMEATIAALRQRGCVLVSPPNPAVAFQGRRIAWLFTPTRQLIEVLEHV
ncbi:MAG: VOC family protein [Phycisphaerales bacterium]